MTEIRAICPGDHAAIAHLNDTAFAEGAASGETALLAALRAEGAMALELVATDGAELIGHIAFSRVIIETEAEHLPAVSLAPMSVATNCQRQGVGAALVRAGLERLKSAGESAVFVIGHPGFYPRFGFSAALARSFSCPWSAEAGDAHMALALQPDIIVGLAGTVRYARAFDPLRPEEPH